MQPANIVGKISRILKSITCLVVAFCHNVTTFKLLYSIKISESSTILNKVLTNLIKKRTSKVYINTTTDGSFLFKTSLFMKVV